MIHYPHILCDECGRDLGDHFNRSAAVGSEAVIVEPDGSELCGDCFEKRHGYEDLVIEYTPPRLAIQDLLDDQKMDEAEITEADYPEQLDLL